MTVKIIIDTNVLVSALRGGKPRETVEIVVGHLNVFAWIASQRILEEYSGVLNRPKFDKIAQFRPALLALISEAITVVPVYIDVEFPRDRKDAKFLACAIAAQVDYLIAGDRDFEDAQKLVGNTKILKVAEFLELPVISKL